MRTKWGVNLDFVKEEFGDHLSSELLIRLESQISAGLVLNHGNVFTLSEKGKYFADRVSSDLFI